MPTRTIAVLTGGGDCPGLNAVIRAIARKASREHGCEVLGILDGFEGAVLGKARALTPDDVSGILTEGGTILGTSNKADPFDFIDGGEHRGDQSRRLIDNLQAWGVDALFCIGGDGTMKCAKQLAPLWPKIIGIPKTIDNDLAATDQTFGFDTACGFVSEALDRLHTTAESHHRVMVVEVMGRYAGWIALCARGAAAARASSSSPRERTPRARDTSSAPSSRTARTRSASAASASSWRTSSNTRPASSRASRCSGTCSAADPPPSSTASSARGTARMRWSSRCRRASEGWSRCAARRSRACRSRRPHRRSGS
jgi:6-phosphofructokinase